MDLKDRTDLPYRFFKPKNSNRWNIRYSIKGHSQIKRALGTADDDEALAKAAEVYQRDVILADAGALASKNSFRAVAKDYVKFRKLQAQGNRQKLQNAHYIERVVMRYLIPGIPNKPIDKITYSDVAQYLDWRRVYWTTGPGANLDYEPYERDGKEVKQKARHKEASNATLKREKSMLNGVFKHGAKLGYIRKGDIPDQDLPKGKSQPRPAFTSEQFSQLYFASQERLLESQRKPEIFFARAVLHCFINLALETGMRPKELYNVDWGHITGLETLNDPSQKARLTIIASAKGKPPVALIPGANSPGTLKDLRLIYQMRFGQLPSPETPVFCNKDGKRLQSIKKSLNALLDAAGLREDGFGRKFSAYSFRHTYATWQLQDPKVDVFMLSKNMRTSVNMIEDYYGHVTAEDFAAIFRGEHKW